MKKVIILCAVVAGLFLISIIVFFAWLYFSHGIETSIEKWENEGTRYITRINKIVASNWSWKAKEKALLAADKILDDSSIPILVNQLHYKGHWWQYWWDYEEVNRSEIYRERTMYVLKEYGSRAFDYLVKDLRRKGPKKTSRNVILAIGLLKTEAAGKKLEELKNDLKWKDHFKTIQYSLKLIKTKEPQSKKSILKKEDINWAIQELNSGIEHRNRPAEDYLLSVVVDELGKFRAEETRIILKQIIEKKPSEILQPRAIRAIGQIGNPDDLPYVIEFVNHNDIDFRREALVALGFFKRTETIPILEKVLKNKYEAPRNKNLAREALNQIM